MIHTPVARMLSQRLRVRPLCLNDEDTLLPDKNLLLISWMHPRLRCISTVNHYRVFFVNAVLSTRDAKKITDPWFFWSEASKVRRARKCKEVSRRTCVRRWKIFVEVWSVVSVGWKENRTTTTTGWGRNRKNLERTCKEIFFCLYMSTDTVRQHTRVSSPIVLTTLPRPVIPLGTVSISATYADRC